MNNVAVGDKVILHPLVTCGLCCACRSGNDVHCGDSKFPGINVDGEYAEYIKTKARSVIKLGEDLELADVAALADAGLTAYHVVAKAAKVLKPGDICDMIGAGGVCHLLESWTDTNEKATAWARRDPMHESHECCYTNRPGPQR